MPSRTLADVAALIRSKNAGPFWLTIDIMFDDDASYAAVRDAAVITPSLIAALYRLEGDQILITRVDCARAIKVSFPRYCASGSPEDTDVLGGQQYAGLLDLPVPG